MKYEIKLKYQIFFLLLHLILIQSTLKRIVPFEKEKSKIEERMNSMRLGNYLRKLMLKV